LECIHAALGIRIDKDTASTRWRGERMNYDQGVWVLFDRVRRARDGAEPEDRYDVPAEISANSKSQPEEDPNGVPWWRENWPCRA
jgi:hypothetical protein